MKPVTDNKMTFNQYVEENKVELVLEILKYLDPERVGFPPNPEKQIVQAEQRTWKASWHDLPFSTYTTDTFRHSSLSLAQIAAEEIKRNTKPYQNVWVENLIGQEEVTSERTFDNEPMSNLHFIFTVCFWKE